MLLKFVLRMGAISNANTHGVRDRVFNKIVYLQRPEVAVPIDQFIQLRAVTKKYVQVIEKRRVPRAANREPYPLHSRRCRGDGQTAGVWFKEFRKCEGCARSSGDALTGSNSILRFVLREVKRVVFGARRDRPEGGRIHNMIPHHRDNFGAWKSGARQHT